MLCKKLDINLDAEYIIWNVISLSIGKLFVSRGTKNKKRPLTVGIVCASRTKAGSKQLPEYIQDVESVNSKCIIKKVFFNRSIRKNALKVKIWIWNVLCKTWRQTDKMYTKCTLG